MPEHLLEVRRREIPQRKVPDAVWEHQVLQARYKHFPKFTKNNNNKKIFSPDVEPNCQSLGGTCRFTSTSCPISGGGFVSGRCPDQPFNVKCCAPPPSSGGGSQCGSSAKSAACEIMTLRAQGRIWLKPDHFDSRGNSPYDGAAVLDNVRDTCQGKKAKR